MPEDSVTVNRRVRESGRLCSTVPASRQLTYHVIWISTRAEREQRGERERERGARDGVCEELFTKEEERANSRERDTNEGHSESDSRRECRGEADSDSAMRPQGERT